ncbi:MAG: YeeE/YedE thiosulfate transporter family protein [Castellaniella sp.]|uniref:YeeE/YedE thiosulfate transporter family protein n=1 Tax=Castellaniella sp. TaxID=1955812 RepID=UPI002A371DFE|nr:YeeE/YedE thiosulfate transporter family protein [Castellaniella sp.]MDY0308499.1 YeeE/YedE thiosulfate transporter family protein [Castellaniella sp.]
MKRLPLAFLILAFSGFLAWSVALRQALLFLVGIGLGAVLAGARFGFTTGWRRLIEQRDPSGVLAQLVLLALAAAVSMPLLAAYPTDLGAALGPPSVSLIVGAFVFGACMQVADGCGSGTLYKAGLGIPLNMAILPLFAIGSFLGSATLDRWLALGALPPYGLVTHFGAPVALLLTLAGLFLVGFGVVRWAGRSAPLWNRKLLWGAVLLAALAVLNLVIAGQPWGIVYGFGLWAAKIATAAHLFDPSANAFWSEPVNAATLAQSVFLDVTSITNIGILAGALWIAAGQSSAAAKPMNGQQWLVGLVAGLLLGYSSRLAFGCNIGAMVSGISTGSVHGWIWVPMAFLGSLIGVRVRRRYAF